ncbi:relaxase/mobilization nuclease domain-containing protein, partial [Escherichia coli]|nr:relaxase/mobilization nuclease domain-containing protein [Escherichia coli]EFH3606515.1 relaxase/mobilization nuclease domain-containing protein [Escherichia coli]
MVPVIPQKRRDGGSSFDDLVSYIVVRDHEEMDKKYQKVEACELRGSETKGNRFSRIVDYLCKERNSGISALEKVYRGGVFQENFHGVTCFHNCSSVETAVAEMQEVADRKRKSYGQFDPVFHYILSWQEHESPRPEQIQDCIRHTMNRLGLTGHQFMAAVHTDTDNLHVHIAVNKVHPVTHKAASLSYSKEKLHRACRELEIKHGFSPDNGAFVIDENQQIVRRSAHERKQLSAWNCDAQENFRNYIRVKTLPFAGKYRSHSWYALHLLMGSRGLKLNRMGNGEVAVCDIRNPERFSVPLSDFGHEWSMSTLTSSVGAWQDAPADILQRLQKLPGYKPVFFEPKTDYAPRPLYRMREKYSLADYACEHIHDAFEKMTWRPEHHTADDLHALFARNGLYLQVQNNELVVCDAYDRKRTPVRAESVHPKLQVPLLADLDGGWKPVPQDIFTQVPPERAYKSEGLERVALSDSERQKVFFGTGPQGAVKREMFSDRESLYGYVVDHCRQKIDDMIREGRFTW